MKKMLKVFLMLPIICLSGCWSSIELNELAIVTALGMKQKVDMHSEVNVTVKGFAI